MQERDQITLGSFDILQIFDWKCTFTEIRVALHKVVAFLVGASEGGLTIVFINLHYVSLHCAAVIDNFHVVLPKHSKLSNRIPL